MDPSLYLQNVAYDSVIFGFSGEELKILIMEYHNTGFFALPGGFVLNDENVDDAARRGLKERTGLENIFLEQFYAFGNISRHQPEVMATILRANGHDVNQYKWITGRFVSIAYYALINYNHVVPKPDALSDSCTWYPVNKLPPLIFEHNAIVKKAVETLRENLDRKLVGMNLLPEKFTMKELQRVYEAILAKKLRRTTFQRKMLLSDVLNRHEKQYNGRAHKAPYLYSFKS